MKLILDSLEKIARRRFDESVKEDGLSKVCVGYGKIYHKGKLIHCIATLCSSCRLRPFVRINWFVDGEKTSKQELLAA